MTIRDMLQTYDVSLIYRNPMDVNRVDHLVESSKGVHQITTTKDQQNHLFVEITTKEHDFGGIFGFKVLNVKSLM